MRMPSEWSSERPAQCDIRRAQQSSALVHVSTPHAEMWTEGGSDLYMADGLILSDNGELSALEQLEASVCIFYC
jgi:hypothetical protein